MHCAKGACVLAMLCLGVVLANPTETNRTREARVFLGRVHIPWLGLGPTCTGCPQHYCDDDLAIIHGYCCGCARAFDNLPVRCPLLLKCPLNNYDLCQDYEYMMYCCCAH